MSWPVSCHPLTVVRPHAKENRARNDLFVRHGGRGLDPPGQIEPSAW
jgi:hypothetical protein